MLVEVRNTAMQLVLLKVCALMPQLRVTLAKLEVKLMCSHSYNALVPDPRQ